MKYVFLAAALMLTLPACSAEQPTPPVMEKTEPPPPPLADEGVACPADAKLCADGSFVSRTAPRCEFAACPGESSK